MSYAPSTRAPRCPTRAEQEKLLKVTGAHVDGFRDRSIFAFALGTGLRENELAQLNVGDVVRGGAPLPRIHLREFKGKGKAKGGPPGVQTVFVSRAVQRKLPKYLAWKKRNQEPITPDAPLFCSGRRAHDRIATRTIRHMCGLWQKRAQIDPPYTFHSLRHACLTNLYASTKDIMLVQRQARHAKITTSQIYAHVTDDVVRRAVEDLPS